MLLGTALTVIIPEGIHTMYATSIAAHDRKPLLVKTDETRVDRKPLFKVESRIVVNIGVTAISAMLQDNVKLREVNIDSVAEQMKQAHNGVRSVVGDIARGDAVSAVLQDVKLLPVHGHEDSARGLMPPAPLSHAGHSDEVHQQIGVVLVLGFIFMLVVDHLSSAFTTGRLVAEMDGAADARRRSKSIPATIGLVIHSAGDGDDRYRYR